MGSFGRNSWLINKFLKIKAKPNKIKVTCVTRIALLCCVLFTFEQLLTCESLSQLSRVLKSYWLAGNSFWFWLESYWLVDILPSKPDQASWLNWFGRGRALDVGARLADASCILACSTAELKFEVCLKFHKFIIIFRWIVTWHFVLFFRSLELLGKAMVLVFEDLKLQNCKSICNGGAW